MRWARWTASARRRRSRPGGRICFTSRRRSPPAWAIARLRSPPSTRPSSSIRRSCGCGSSSAALEEERGNWAAARAAYERALDLLPTYSAAAIALADLLRRTETPRAAIGVLVRLLEADPYELEALTALGRALLEDGRTVQALEAFERVLRFDPEHAGALYYEGGALARQRQFDQAVQAWERVVQLDPAGPYAAQARTRARSARDLQHIFAASVG